MSLNLSTGEWDDDEHPLGGDVGEQAGAPVVPVAPPVSQAPGPEVIPPPAALGAPAPVMPVPGMPPPGVNPYQPQVMPPIPTSRVVTPAEAGNLAAIDQNTAARATTAQDAGNVSAEEKLARVQEADRREWLADAKLQERNRIADEATKRIQARTAQADADYKEYKSFGIKDPEASDNFATSILKAVVVGLGQYASGINGGPNAALAIITDANKENINRQKAQQEKLFQTAQRSGKDVEVARQERDDSFKQLDLKHSALLESSAAMLRSELARMGVPQAQIDANKDIQKIEQEGLAIRERTLAGIRDDETALARADIAAAARKKATKTGGGGGAKLEGSAQLAEYAQANPGDTAGLYRLGAKLGLGQKDVNAAINQNKASEGAQGTATKAAAALSAIDRIDKLGYKPTRDEIQKWLTNQREVARAEEAGKGGGAASFVGSALASGAQGIGWLAQNEYEGLSPRARMYFTNVRQYMENIGREASGAAISQGEWNNFYGQYGPQSEGGLNAARENIRNRFKLTGVAGRSLEASGGVPPVSEKKGGNEEDEKTKQARQIVNDPAAAAKAAKQYKMTVEQVKAKALLHLRSARQPAADITL